MVANSELLSLIESVRRRGASVDVKECPRSAGEGRFVVESIRIFGVNGFSSDSIPAVRAAEVLRGLLGAA